MRRAGFAPGSGPNDRPAASWGFPVLAALLVAASACGDRAPSDPSAEIQIDTLPNGVIHVSNPAQGLWAPGEEWRLVEELRIGSVEGDGPEVFGGTIPDLEVDGMGRIWVADSQSREVRIFGPDGEHIRTLGGEGEGPGEFRSLSRIVEGADGTFSVVDPSLARHTVFDSSGALVETRSGERGGSLPGPLGGVDREGRVFEAFSELDGEGVVEYLIRSDGGLTPVDTFPLPFRQDLLTRISQPGTGFFGAPVLYGHRRVSAVTADHHVWTAYTDAFRLAHLTPEGDTLRIVEKAWIPEPLPGELRTILDEGFSNLEEEQITAYAETLPEERAPFREFRVDDEGRLWIPPHGDFFTSPWDRFHVFDAEGRYLGVAEADPPLSGGGPVRFRGGRAYAIVLDELDVPYVVRYRIEGVP